MGLWRTDQREDVAYAFQISLSRMKIKQILIFGGRALILFSLVDSIIEYSMEAVVFLPTYRFSHSVIIQHVDKEDFILIFFSSFHIKTKDLSVFSSEIS